METGNWQLETFLQKYRYHLLIILLGLIFISAGFLFFKNGINYSSTKVEILNSENAGPDSHEVLTVEISGEVIKPGVYKLPDGSRIDDLLIVGGGLTASADRVWTDKYLNRAAKLTDGQKVYIPSVNQQSLGVSANFSGVYQNESPQNLSDSSNLININTGSLSELDTLPGIGPKYGQKIIDHRPYSKTEDLVTGGVITQTLYEKIKNIITVY